MKKNLFVLIGTVILLMVGCGSKPTLSQWVDSDDVATAEELTNEEFAESGLGIHAKFSADGEDIFVISYIYEEYRYLAGRDQSEIDAIFSEELNSLGVSANLPTVFDECEKATGITLKCIRMQCVNADGTIMYSQDYVDTK